MPDDDLRSTLTSRARSHWADVVEGVHERMAGKLADAKTAQLGDVLERFERELVPHLAPFLAELVNNEDVPEPIRALMQAVIEPEHFTQSLLVGIALGSVISPVLGAATAPYIQSLSNVTWPTNPSIPLSPPELALGLLRHNPHIGDAAGEAAQSGISAERLQALLYNTGEALALGELLLLYRRGQITQDRLVTGLRQSRIRDEWLPEVLDLQFAPPPAGEVITGSLKGHLSDADAQRKLGEAGINPDNFAWLRATSGRPPGTMEMLGLWNRGYTTQARVEAAVRQSDVNDDFLPEVLNLRWYHVPPRSIVPMLRSGAITEARARTLLDEHGVRVEDQDAFIKEATKPTTTTVKELGAAQVVRGYELHLVTHAEALARLEALKYNAEDAALYLDIADGARDQQLIDGAITRIRSAYLSHKITKQVAQTDMGKLQVPAAAQTQYLTVWDNELFANVQVLSISQLQGGYYRGILTLAQFIAQVQQRGWSGIQVKILAAEAWPHGKVPDAVINLNAADL